MAVAWVGMWDRVVWWAPPPPPHQVSRSMPCRPPRGAVPPAPHVSRAEPPRGRGHRRRARADGCRRRAWRGAPGWSARSRRTQCLPALSRRCSARFATGACCLWCTDGVRLPSLLRTRTHRSREIRCIRGPLLYASSNSPLL